LLVVAVVERMVKQLRQVKVLVVQAVVAVVQIMIPRLELELLLLAVEAVVVEQLNQPLMVQGEQEAQELLL
jgi:hypothetical protein